MNRHLHCSRQISYAIAQPGESHSPLFVNVYIKHIYERSINIIYTDHMSLGWFIIFNKTWRFLYERKYCWNVDGFMIGIRWMVPDTYIVYRRIYHTGTQFARASPHTRSITYTHRNEERRINLKSLPPKSQKKKTKKKTKYRPTKA